MDEFFEPSPLAKSVSNGANKSKYPWHQCPVGQSFWIDKENANEKTLRNLAYKVNKKWNKNYKLVIHPKGYELYNCPMENK